VDIELRRGRDIARHGHGPAHHHDPGGLGQPAAVTLERARDVGQGAQRDDDEPAREPIRGLQNQIGPVQHLKGMDWLGVSRLPVRPTEAAEVAEAVVTVDMGRRDQRAHERAGGALRHPRPARRPGDVPRPRHVQYPEGVGGAEVDLDIARDRGDGLHRYFGRGESQQDGKGIVDAGIGVDENRRAHQLTPRTPLRIIPAGGQFTERRRIG
jgi:hypothetical protein